MLYLIYLKFNIENQPRAPSVVCVSEDVDEPPPQPVRIESAKTRTVIRAKILVFIIIVPFLNFYLFYHKAENLSILNYNSKTNDKN